MFSRVQFVQGVGRILIRFGSTSTASQTALYELHLSQKGKIVDFAGYLLPVQYDSMNITESHLHTRKSCSLFDVSHMLQTRIMGKDRIEYFESLCTTDLGGLKINSSALSLFTDEKTGGILDDLIVSKCEDQLCVVSNASRRRHDSDLMLQKQEQFRALGKDVNVHFLDTEERSLLALQGPKACEALQKLTKEDLSRLYFMETAKTGVDGVECRITRCGYTGEDGFEISLPSGKAIQVAEALLNNEAVRLAGLGARDTLRLEAGLCLYGNDIDISTTPVSAGLMWTVGKARRTMKNFPGAEVILGEWKQGPERKRVGLVPRGEGRGPPVRNGCPVLPIEGNTQIGLVTSGCPSPSLGTNIAMAYVESAHAKSGTQLRVQVRNTVVDMVVTKMPFVPSKYYTPKKN